MIDYHVKDADGNIVKSGKCKPNHSRLKRDDTFIGKAQTLEPRYTIQDLRIARNQLLFDTDWTQMPDSPLSSADKTKYATYRQKLRDLPASYTTETNLENVIFPEVDDD